MVLNKLAKHKNVKFSSSSFELNEKDLILTLTHFHSLSNYIVWLRFVKTCPLTPLLYANFYAAQFRRRHNEYLKVQEFMSYF